VARAGNELDLKLGRDPTEDVTFDLDATGTRVFGRRTRGTGRGHGHLAYNYYAVTWADRGRALTSELKGGNQARITAAEVGRMLGRAERLLPMKHGQITVRGDTGFNSIELMIDCRKRGIRFTFSATRTSLMWSKLSEIDDHAWGDAIAGAHVWSDETQSRSRREQRGDRAQCRLPLRREPAPVLPLATSGGPVA